MTIGGDIDAELNVISGRLTVRFAADGAGNEGDAFLLWGARKYGLSVDVRASSASAAVLTTEVPPSQDLQEDLRLFVRDQAVHAGPEAFVSRRIDVRLAPRLEAAGRTKKLSVCIPTYNRARRVEQAVRSVLASDRDDIEVVVSDNASTDDTLERLAAIDDPRLRVQPNPENFGPLRNFLLALSRAEGEYCLLHSDEDTVEADAVSALIDFLAANPEVGSGIASVEGSVVFEETEVFAAGRDALVASGRGYTYLGGFFYRTADIPFEAFFAEFGDPNFLYPFENIAWSLSPRSAFALFSPTVVRRGVNEKGSFAPIDGRHFNHPANLVHQLTYRERVFDRFAGAVLSDADTALVHRQFEGLMLRQNFAFAFELSLADRFELLSLLRQRGAVVFKEPVVRSLVQQTMAELALEAGSPSEGRSMLERSLDAYPQNSSAALLLARACRGSGDAAGEERAYAVLLENVPRRWSYLYKLIPPLRRNGRDEEVDTIIGWLEDPATATPNHVLEGLRR